MAARPQTLSQGTLLILKTLARGELHAHKAQLHLETCEWKIIATAMAHAWKAV